MAKSPKKLRFVDRIKFWIYVHIVKRRSAAQLLSKNLSPVYKNAMLHMFNNYGVVCDSLKWEGWDDEVYNKDYCCALTIRSKVPIKMAFCLDDDLLNNIANAYLGSKHQTIDREIKEDIMQEVCNNIVGNLQARIKIAYYVENPRLLDNVAEITYDGQPNMFVGHTEFGSIYVVCVPYRTR